MMMTLDIAITYTHSTRLLAITGQDRTDEAIGGTYGDGNSTKLTFTISGLTDVIYTVKCAVGSPIHTNNEVECPEYALTNNSVTLPAEVMASAMHGVIPIQLHFTTTGDDPEEWYSLNSVKLRILPAIPATDESEISPTPVPTSDIVTDVTYSDDTLTIHYAEAQQKDIALNTPKIVRQAYIQTNSTDTQYTYTYNLGYMPTKVIVYERSDARDQSIPSHRTTYDETMAHTEVELGIAAKYDEVTFTFASPPGDVIFWVKVIA